MHRVSGLVRLDGVREWVGWSRIIEHSLISRELSLHQSALSDRLMVGLGHSDVMDQSACSVLWSEAEKLSDDPLLGLTAHYSENDLPLSLQMIGLTISASLSMSCAVNNLVRFFALVSTQAGLELRVAEGDAQLLLSPRGRPHPQHMLALLGMVGRLLHRCAQRCGVDSPQISVGMPLQQAAVLTLSWCRQSGFSERYWLSFPREWLGRTLPEATPGLMHGMTGILHGVLASMPTGDIAERVRQAIQQGMSKGVLGEEQIAAPMGISTRHLRRLLRQHATSYERLLDEVRQDMALRLLADGQSSLTRIAYELGFQDPSSFTRAFRRWTGCSPSDFRRRQA